MSLKNQGYSIAGFVMGLFMITLLLLFGYFIYFNVRMDKIKQDNYNYQIVDMITSDKYMQCILGEKYIISISYNGSADIVSKLKNSFDQSESCDVKIYHGNNQLSESMIKDNKRFLKVY